LLKRFFVAGCALIAATAACSAQQTPASAASSGSTSSAAPADPANAQGTTPIVDRKIENMIRAELNVPPQYLIAIGGRQKSDVSGFDTIPVTFSLPNEPQRKQTIDFLLSKDSNTLARLSKWDIGTDPTSQLPLEGRPVRGNPDARVTIVNFDDLECPYCAAMNSEFFPRTLNRYKGLVKFVYLDYPLAQIHPWAMHAAVNANCLATQNANAYWNYVDYLHTHGQDITGPDRDLAKSNVTLDKLADQEGARDQLDASKLDACLAKQDDTKIMAEMRAADKAGVEATPTFFVSGERWAGQLEENQLWTMIDRALTEQGITPPSSGQPAAHAPAAPAPSK
jgi:protein-disulfide isomerase